MPAIVTAEEIHLTRSEFTEALIWLDGKRFSLADFQMFKAIYDGDYPKMLLKTSRQVGKSTTASNFIIAESITRPFHKTLYIAPTAEQTHKFSSLRVGKSLAYSPFLSKYVIQDRVLVRLYKNGSENSFSYCLDSADRIRGISADRILLDEVQDLILPEVMPVAVECMRQSDMQFQILAGTPKTFDNAIEDYWLDSSQTEWVMKCSGCSKWTFVDSEKGLKPHGPVCVGCGTLLNPKNGQWVDMKSGSDMKGFHISQPIMPRNIPICWPESTDPSSRYVKALMRWKEIMSALEGPKAYPIAKFRNEILGVSDSQGVRLIVREDLTKLCTGHPSMPIRPDPRFNGDIIKVSIGADFSGGGIDQVSTTAIAVLGLTKQRKLRLLYYRLFIGEHPIKELAAIREVLAMYQPELVACDAGEGLLQIEELRKQMNWYHRIQKIRYGAGGAHIKWNAENGSYSVNRTAAIDSFMMAVLRAEFIFPNNIEAMTPAFDHILAEFTDVTNAGRKIWQHSKSDPDDFLHAIIYARLAMQMATGEIDLTS
jgi:hypothetical protein